MSRTLTAMFDHRSDAEAAREALLDAAIEAADIEIHDRTSAGYSDTEYSTYENRGFWASLRDLFLPDEDRYTYEEGVRRGGAVLTVVVDEDDVDTATRILDAAKSVDVEERASAWRAEGWTHPAPVTSETTATTGAGTTPAGGWAGTRATETLGAEAGEERIPIVEEQVRIGKREVDRGGVRVRSYVVEEPVHEDVSLRQEHVSVERRPVDLPLSAADDAFRERTIEVTERGEEAVVQKDARVREELVVKKDVEERVKPVDASVRRTEVEVEDVDRDGTRTVRDAPVRRSGV